MSLSDNLVAHWKLEEASGTRLDETANNHDLTDNNTVTQGTGKIDSCADFEDANAQEFLSLVNHADFTPAGDFSFTCWVKPESNSSERRIFSKWKSGTNERQYNLKGATGSGAVRWYISNDGSAEPSVSAGINFTAGTWYFIYVYHEDGTEIGISINDGTVQTTAHTTGLATKAQSFCVGALNTPGQLEWDGLIDELSFRSRILTTDEVTQLYNSGSGISYPWPTVFYKVLSGVITNTGSLKRTTFKTVAGSITNTGSLAKLMILGRTIMSGSITNTGSLVKQTNKVVAGSITNTGTLVRKTLKIIAGSITNTGALKTIIRLSRIIFRMDTSISADMYLDVSPVNTDKPRGRL